MGLAASVDALRRASEPQAMGHALTFVEFPDFTGPIVGVLWTTHRRVPRPRRIDA